MEFECLCQESAPATSVSAASAAAVSSSSTCFCSRATRAGLTSGPEGGQGWRPLLRARQGTRGAAWRGRLGTAEPHHRLCSLPGEAGTRPGILQLPHPWAPPACTGSHTRVAMELPTALPVHCLHDPGLQVVLATVWGGADLHAPCSPATLPWDQVLQSRKGAATPVVEALGCPPGPAWGLSHQSSKPYSPLPQRAQEFLKDPREARHHAATYPHPNPSSS